MLKAMLLAAVALGYTLQVAYEGEDPDYEGTDVTEAIEAIEACDEMTVYVCEEDEDGGLEMVGYAYIVNDLDEDEQIADCSGWCDKWLEMR